MPYEKGAALRRGEAPGAVRGPAPRFVLESSTASSVLLQETWAASPAPEEEFWPPQPARSANARVPARRHERAGGGDGHQALLPAPTAAELRAGLWQNLLHSPGCKRAIQSRAEQGRFHFVRARQQQPARPGPCWRGVNTQPVLLGQLTKLESPLTERPPPLACWNSSVQCLQ